MTEIEHWGKHLYRVGQHIFNEADPPEDTQKIKDHRKKIEPWLSAVFQSDHLSLLVGNGLLTAIANAAGSDGVPSMAKAKFNTQFAKQIDAHADELARTTCRGTANVEDQMRAAMALAEGLTILGKANHADAVTSALKGTLNTLVNGVLATENSIGRAVEAGSEKGNLANRLLCSFLLSFGSRAGTRERLHIFTTNYDRVIEYGCDWIGLRVLDRFVGHLSPIFRSSRVDVDMHYNPPGFEVSLDISKAL